MRLELRHSPEAAAEIERLREDDGYVSDSSVALRYRPELVGRPFCELLQEVMRGALGVDGGRTRAVRRLRLGTQPVPVLNGVPRAVASYALRDPELVDRVLANYQTAPVGERLRGALHFLATLDPEPALATGVSRAAPRERGYV
jgi:hypothetical protein